MRLPIHRGSHLLVHIADAVAVGIQELTTDIRERVRHVAGIKPGPRDCVVAVVGSRIVAVAQARAKTVTVRITTRAARTGQRHAPPTFTHLFQRTTTPGIQRLTRKANRAGFIAGRQTGAKRRRRRLRKRSVQPARRARFARELRGAGLAKVRRPLRRHPKWRHTQRGKGLTQRLLVRIKPRRVGQSALYRHIGCSRYRHHLTRIIHRRTRKTKFGTGIRLIGASTAADTRSRPARRKLADANKLGASVKSTVEGNLRNAVAGARAAVGVRSARDEVRKRYSPLHTPPIHNVAHILRRSIRHISHDIQ